MKVAQLFEARGKTAKGWTIVDKSFITKGTDPTQVVEYELSKDGTVIKITEFFGDWSWKDNKGNASAGALTRAQLDKFLVSKGAPTHGVIDALFHGDRDIPLLDPRGWR